MATCQSKILVELWEIISILTGNVLEPCQSVDWHGSSTAQDSKALQTHTHHSHSLLTPRRSGKRYRSIHYCLNNRLSHSSFIPLGLETVLSSIFISGNEIKKSLLYLKNNSNFECIWWLMPSNDLEWLYNAKDGMYKQCTGVHLLLAVGKYSLSTRLHKHGGKLLTSRRTKKQKNYLVMHLVYIVFF